MVVSGGQTMYYIDHKRRSATHTPTTITNSIMPATHDRLARAQIAPSSDPLLRSAFVPEGGAAHRGYSGDDWMSFSCSMTCPVDNMSYCVRIYRKILPRAHSGCLPRRARAPRILMEPSVFIYCGHWFATKKNV